PAQLAFSPAGPSRHLDRNPKRVPRRGQAHIANGEAYCLPLWLLACGLVSVRTSAGQSARAHSSSSHHAPFWPCARLLGPYVSWRVSARSQIEVSRAMPFRLRTFGGLSLTGESGPVTGAATQRRKLALLAVLATAGERRVSHDRLLALFWSESDAEHARHALTQSLSALRRELGSDDLFLGSADLSLNPALIDSDVADLETALARTELERDIALYVGPFLDGVHL